MDNYWRKGRHRHAYLIMAHNNWGVLTKLFSFLDSPDNDIYFHIDKKAKDFDWQKIKTLCKTFKIHLTKRTKDLSEKTLS